MKYLFDKKINYIFIPSGMTAISQPLDLSIKTGTVACIAMISSGRACLSESIFICISADLLLFIDKLASIFEQPEINGIKNISDIISFFM